jgi:hypothetical protein
MLVVTMESKEPMNYHNGLLTVMKGCICGTASGQQRIRILKCESFSKTRNSDQYHL